MKGWVLGLLAGAAIVLAGVPSAAGAAPSQAPGAPGGDSYFDLARKDCVGTARNTGSKVWFTVADGVLSDTYWPTVDATNVHTLQYIVTDGHGFTDLQTRDMTYKVIPDFTGMSCTVVATPTDTAHGYRITTTYIADPARDAVLMRTRFAGPRGDRLYVRLDPLAGGTGGGGSQNAGGNSAVVTAQGVPVAFNTNTTTTASNRDYAVPTYMALESSNGFSSASVGYADSASDGQTMLDSAHSLTTVHLGARRPRDPHRRPARAARPDRRPGPRLREDAGSGPLCRRHLGAPALRPRVVPLRAAVAALRPRAPSPLPRPRRRRGPRVLRVGQRGQGQRGQDVPWRDRRRSRLAVGPGRARRILLPAVSRCTSAPIARCSRAISTRRSPACWWRATSAPPGTPPASCSSASSSPMARCRATRWRTARSRPTPAALQLDETSYPILMAWQSGLARDSSLYANHVIPAADFLVAHGPSDGVERWEEQSGYSPSTIAAEIAGLTAAAHIAQVNDDPVRADVYQADRR